jgi:hypothetical protein
MNGNGPKILFLGALLVFSLSCEKEEITEALTQYATVRGWIHARQDTILGWRGYVEAIVAGEPAPRPESTWVLASVGVEYDTLTLTSPELPLPGALVYTDSSALLTGLTYRLSVASNIGTCMGEVELPRDFEIEEPDSDEAFDLEQDVAVQWSVSNGADWYSAHVTLHPYHPDSGWFEERDTVLAVKTNAAVLEAGYLAVPLATYVGVEVFVYAHGGPMPEDAGNMEGEFQGYLVATTEPDQNDVSFHVGTLPAEGFPPAPENRARRAIRSLLGL